MRREDICSTCSEEVSLFLIVDGRLGVLKLSAVHFACQLLRQVGKGKEQGGWVGCFQALNDEI